MARPFVRSESLGLLIVGTLRNHSVLAPVENEQALHKRILDAVKPFPTATGRTFEGVGQTCP